MKSRSMIFQCTSLQRLVLSIIILALVCTGCPDPDKKSGDSQPTDVKEEEIVFLTSVYVTKDDGGLLHIASNDDELNGASVAIPPNAVDEEIKLYFGTLESMPENSSYGQFPLGNIFALEPSGTQFDESVTITLPVPAADIDTPIYIGRWDANEKKWENLGGTVQGDFMSTTIDHLSIYAIFYLGKSDVRIINEADPNLADLGVRITYEAGPAIFSDILEDESFPAYRPFPEIETLLQNGQSIDMALLPGRYRFMINYPHPQPGRGNHLYFTIPVLSDGADDGNIDQTISITMDGASSTDVFTDFSIVFPGYTADAADNLRPVITTCNAVVPVGVPVVDALTGLAPTETTHVVNIGPIKSEQVANSGLTLMGRATDPENYPDLDAFWTDGNYFTPYIAAPGETITYAFERTKGGTYTVYLTLYDEYDLFDQCQWNITVIPNALPYVDVVVDDTVIDFGRLDGFRRNYGAAPFPGALPGPHPNPFGLPQGGFLNWGRYDIPPLPGPPVPAAQGNPTASTELKRIDIYEDPGIPATTHVNPVQNPGGMTIVYAIVADADGDPINAGFVFPEPITGKGNFYTAIDIPGGIPRGTLIDTDATLAAYNSRLSQLANIGVIQNQPHEIPPETLLPFFPPPLPNGPPASVEPTQIIVYPNFNIEAPVTIIRKPREFPYVVAFNNGVSKILPGDIVTEAPSYLGLIPQGKVYKVIVKQGNWNNGDAKGYLWMIPVLNDFWDKRHDFFSEPELFVNDERVATVSFVGQALPIIWEAPDDPDLEQTTHDRRHIDPNVIPAGGKLNIEARVTDNIGAQQRAFAWVAWPEDKEKHCHDIDGDGFFAETDCDTEVDCDDENAEIKPDADEICNDTIDNDCDEATDCDDVDCSDSKICTCIDNDDDGYYANSGCGTEIDCDDDAKEVNPGKSEVCDDKIDNDCNDQTDCDDSACQSHSSCQVVQTDCSEEYETYHELEETLNRYCGVTGVGLFCTRFSFYNCSNSCVSTTYWPGHNGLEPDAADVFNSTACSSYPGYVSCAESAFSAYISCLEACNADFLNGEWGPEHGEELYILQNVCAPDCQEEVKQVLNTQCVAE